MLRFAEEACGFYSEAAAWGFVVHPSIPIVFFGDLEAYWASRAKGRWRVITVGLNPSAREYPERRRFSRFPDGRGVPSLIAKGRMKIAARASLKSVSSYFNASDGSKVYERWFKNYRDVLLAMGYDYSPNEAGGVALHTDYVSPLATNPGFPKLGVDQQRRLKMQAQGWWLRLLDCLRPDVVLISMRRGYFEEIASDFV